MYRHLLSDHLYKTQYYIIGETKIDVGLPILIKICAIQNFVVIMKFVVKLRNLFYIGRMYRRLLYVIHMCTNYTSLDFNSDHYYYYKTTSMSFPLRKKHNII